MKKKRCLIYLLFLFMVIGVVFYAFKVNALYLKTNDVVYFVDNNDWGNIYIYLYNESGGSAFSWQDSKGKMMDTGEDICDVNGKCHNLYKYVISSGYNNKFDQVVFSSTSSGKQTIDLYYIRNGTMFATNTSAETTNDEDNGKYSGAWFVYDKTELKELVEDAKNVDSAKYTKSSYDSLKATLDTAEKVLELTYDVSSDKKNTVGNVLVDYDGNSSYDSIVSNLKTAVDGLVLKNKINVATPVGGNISVNESYFEDNETVEFTVKPSDGYEVVSVSVAKVTGYDNNVPILSTESETLNINTTGVYSYVAGIDDIYIDATFKLKEYTITTTINEAEGTIDPKGPIKVEHKSSKEFTITATEGYNIKKVTVNGEDYTFENGKLTLNDITQDMEIVVTFEIKTYVVKIDGVDYRITHGSLLSDLSSYNNIIARDGYKFEGFKLSGTDKDFDLNTKITSDIELETVFTLIPVEPEEDLEGGMGVVGPDTGNLDVPNTGDSIVYAVLTLIVSIVTIVGLFIYRKKKMN